MTDPNTTTLTGFWAVFFLVCMGWGFINIMMSLIFPFFFWLWRFVRRD